MRRAVAVLAALLLAACDQDTPNFTYAAEREPVVNGDAGAIVVAQGTAVAVLPWLSRREVEGSTQIPVRDARSDDPTIARVVPTSHEFNVGYRTSEPAVIIFGMQTGATKLRLFNSNGTDVGTLSIAVVGQEP